VQVKSFIKETIMFKKPEFSGRELARHVVVISLDAMSESDWETVSSLPYFSHILANGSYTKSLKSVFPTHTYVVHTSMVTGVHPDKHGIIHNHPLQPFVPDEDQDWYWYQNQIKAPTIYDLARKHRMKTAGLMWPVSGKSSIQFNMPELAAVRGENQALKIMKNGTLSYVLGLELKLGSHRKSTNQPFLDDFIAECAVDTIKNIKPNLMLIHLCDVDDAKHKYRIDSQEVRDAFCRSDKRIGAITQAVEDAGLKKDTVILVLGDHGQFNADYNVHLNNLLRDAGLIYDDNGKLNWRAYLQTTGGNAYLHIKDGDVEAEKTALQVLRKAMEEEGFGIEAIYDRERLDALHAPKELKYVVEAKPGYHFHDDLNEVTIENYLEQGKKYATHGYSPEKVGYRCIFMAAGSDIKKNHPLGAIEMVDVAPTIARILGMEFYPCDGRVLEEMFQ
jgi:predicted AlkP superfamily pyrophosphatase or phosphodiesterase